MVSGDEIERRLEAKRNEVDLPENERSKKTSGIIGWWNRQSTGGKAAIGLIGLCCFGVLIFIGMAGMFTPDNTTTEPTYTTPEPVKTTPVESESEYKASCKTISFKELNKNPDKYIGERVKYTGRVVQIMESGGSTDIRMDVDDVFGDTIYVTYDGTTSAVEDNMITVYGEVYGSHTYESIAGYQITLPRITAKYIEL